VVESYRIPAAAGTRRDSLGGEASDESNATIANGYGSQGEIAGGGVCVADGDYGVAGSDLVDCGDNAAIVRSGEFGSQRAREPAGAGGRAPGAPPGERANTLPAAGTPDKRASAQVH